MKKQLTVLILLLLAASVIGYFLYPTVSDQLGRQRDAEIMAVYREKTAALDAETSSRVIKAILALKNRTRIVVTHDLDAGTLQKYDSILTLKNGRIVEDGSFDTLMKNKGYFYSLYTVAQ